MGKLLMALSVFVLTLNSQADDVASLKRRLAQRQLKSGLEGSMRIFDQEVETLGFSPLGGDEKVVGASAMALATVLLINKKQILGSSARIYKKLLLYGGISILGIGGGYRYHQGARQLEANNDFDPRADLAVGVLISMLSARYLPELAFHGKKMKFSTRMGRSSLTTLAGAGFVFYFIGGLKGIIQEAKTEGKLMLQEKHEQQKRLETISANIFIYEELLKSEWQDSFGEVTTLRLIEAFEQDENISEILERAFGISDSEKRDEIEKDLEQFAKAYLEVKKKNSSAYKILTRNPTKQEMLDR